MSRANQREPRECLLEELRRQLDRSVTAPTDAAAVFSSGVAAIDRLLPGGGLRHGMLIEWLVELPGASGATLGLLAAREACRAGGMLVVVDRRQTFYPPAAVAWGVDLRRVILVHPRAARDELWATVQSLRSPVVAAVWATIERLDDRAFRRLQLAAEAGRALGVLVRPAEARGQPSWADVRLGVGTRQGDKKRGRQGEHGGQRVSLSPYLPVSLSSFATRLVHVSVLHCRGGRSRGSVLVEIDDAAHAIREVKVQKAIGYQQSAIGQSFLPTAESR